MIKINLFPEKWKVIPHHPDYAVSNQGRVMRITDANGTYPGKILKPILDRYGYFVIDLWKDGKHKIHKIARLVALCFLGPCPVGKQTNHKNSIRTYNRITNLEYLTPKENVHHSIFFGLRNPKGESNPNAKLKEQDVFSIIKLRKLGWTHQKIANKFNVTTTAIYNILLGQSWNWLTNIRKPHVS